MQEYLNDTTIPAYITKEAIISEYGWPQSLVIRLLSEPDAEVEILQDGRPTLIPLYLEEVIMEIMQMSFFEEELADEVFGQAMLAQDARLGRKRAATLAQEKQDLEYALA